MAGVKISALPPVGSALTTDIFPVVQAGVTQKETVAQLITLINTSLTGYLPITGGTMLGQINMGGLKIVNAANPTLAQDLATKFYVDSVASGLNILPACYAASTVSLTATYNNVSVPPSGVGATLTNAGAMVAFSIDGVSPPINSRILIKDQASSLQNGIYTLTTVGSGATNWVLTRATDYDQPVEVNPGDFVLINFGTVNTATAWVETATVTSIGVDSILFSRFNSGTVSSVGTAGLATGGPITTIGTVTVTAAVKADQTTGTSTTVAVVPGVQQFHPSSTKAWAYVTVAGAVYTVAGGYNVSSVVHLGTGEPQIVFTVAFTTANYACVGTVAASIGTFFTITRAAGNIAAFTLNSSFVAADFNFQVLVSGVQ